MTRWLMWATVLAGSWGAAGCLGDSTGPPLPPADTVAFATYDLGAFHACGLTAAGRAYCWGANGVAQLGTGTFEDEAVPRRVAQGTAVYRQVTLGGGHTCAVLSTEVAHCWGLNDRGQLGLGTQGLPVGQPTRVAAGRLFSFIAAGGAHTCGLDQNGFAWCWGLAESGRLGNGVSGVEITRPTPDSVLFAEPFAMLTLGNDHTCGLTADGRAYCWGSGALGQLGIGASENRDTPTLVSGGHVFAQLDAGGLHTCGVTLDGDGYCWGDHASGQLGMGSGGPQAAPTAVSGARAWRSIHAGGNHSCAVTIADEAYCWGLNDSGQLGDGTSASRNVPTAVSGGLAFQSVVPALGPFTTGSCGRATTGVLYCWGYGVDGIVGNGAFVSVAVPTRVAGQLGP